jgi:hypothetical protein
MRGAALLIVLALLPGGCEKRSSKQLGSPGSSVAGTETQQDDRSRSPKHSRELSSRSGVASPLSSLSSLIAVPTTTAGEAPPCERVCGSLGDCLLADADEATSAAGLELACLDMCVHSADTAPAKVEFLACGTQSECGSLQACAERTWTALADARQRPEIEGVVAPENTCLLACTWMYSCIATGTPPGQVPFDPGFEQIMQQGCVEPCEQMPTRESWRELPGCFANDCSYDGVQRCVEQANL